MNRRKLLGSVTAVAGAIGAGSLASNRLRDGDRDGDRDGGENGGPPADLDDRAWEVTWRDEFDGDSLDRDAWTYQNGNGHDYDTPGWGNDELQYYRPENVRIEDDRLVVDARREAVSDEHGTYDYTSGKIVTAPPDQDRGSGFSFAYGRVDIRARLPTGTGAWPAFWMLPDDIYRGNPWPDCGEIDIMELVSQSPATVHGSLHGPDYFAADSIHNSTSLESGTFEDAFHTFSIVWDEDAVKWFVDFEEYAAVDRDYVETVRDSEWVFDREFHLLFNVAVGGVWPESPDPDAFPQRMEVDYVRVYDEVGRNGE